MNAPHGPQPGHFGPPPYPAAPYPPQHAPSGGSAGKIIAIVAGVVLAAVFVVGVLAVLAVSGVRKYIANAKTAEARNVIAQIAKDAAATYEQSGTSSTSSTESHLCPGASAPIPSDDHFVSGQKYMSANAEWQIDASREAGFACLGFSLAQPQYYQYRYDTRGPAVRPMSFNAIARGDLDGDREFSEFSLSGRVEGSHLVVAPTMSEVSPFE